MRSERGAICTSGDPVSPSWVRNCSTRVFFFSTDRRMATPPGGSPPNRPAPRAPINRSVEAGSSKCLDNQPFRRKVPRPEPGVKHSRHPKRSLWRGEVRDGGAGGLDVRHDLLLEQIDAAELHLWAKALLEGQGQRPVVEVAGEIQQEGLDPVLVVPERGP